MDASITILLSVYSKDNPIFLNECLESIYLQEDQPDAVLIVIEGFISINLMDVINKWRVLINNFKTIDVPNQVNKYNFGLPFCLNIGNKHINTSYRCKLDSDDICYPQRIKLQREFITNNTHVDLCGSYIDEFDSNPNFIKRVKKVPLNHQKILKYAQYRNPINGPTMIFKKSSAIEIGGFPEVGSNEDYCFVGKFIVNGLILANINKSLVKFRAGNELVSRRMGKRYILGEQEALLYLYKIGLFNKTVYLFHYYGKKIIRNLPHKFNSILYTKFLRTN